MANSGESDEAFLARMEAEEAAAFAAAVAEWRGEKAAGRGEAQIVEARGGFADPAPQASPVAAGESCSQPPPMDPHVFRSAVAMALAVLEQIVGPERRGAEKTLKATFRKHQAELRQPVRAAVANWVLGVCCLRARLDHLLVAAARSLAASLALTGAPQLATLRLRARLSCWLAIFMLEPPDPEPDCDSDSDAGADVDTAETQRPPRVLPPAGLVHAWLHEVLGNPGEAKGEAEGEAEGEGADEAQAEVGWSWLSGLPSVLPRTVTDLAERVRAAVQTTDTGAGAGCAAGATARTNLLAAASSFPLWLWREWEGALGAPTL